MRKDYYETYAEVMKERNKLQNNGVKCKVEAVFPRDKFAYDWGYRWCIVFISES